MLQKPVIVIHVYKTKTLYMLEKKISVYIKNAHIYKTKRKNVRK